MSAAVDTILGITFPMEPWRPFGPDGLELAPFGFLVAIGIVLGTIIAGRRAKQFGLSERVVADVALLIARERQQPLQARVGEVAATWPAEYAFELTGPWAPYNFVELRLQGGGRAGVAGGDRGEGVPWAS